MPEAPKKHRFLYSAYIFSLTVFLMAAALIASIWMMIAAPVADDRGVLIALILGIDLLLFGALFSSRETLGWYTITEDSISLHAPFRRTLTLRYEDVQYVGAGRNFLSVNYAYWLYLSCDRVPVEQLEDMRRFQLTKRGLRIAYSRKAFAALMDCLPEDLAMQLDRSRTTLRAWGVKDV
ncbi:MAG: hypothetical protein IJE07_12310 [Clostridia bacterium]|nr:hypothetical protein [Clostridia bacterium]